MIDAGLAQAIVALSLVPDNYLTAPENGKLALEDKTANMTMEIIGPPAEAVGIRMENLGHLPGIRPKLRLDGERMIGICDFLVLAEVDDVSYAVFIEMKRTQSDEERPKEQLLWSPPILHYLQSLCAIAGRFSSPALRIPARAAIAERYWLIGKYGGRRQLDKQTVGITRQPQIVSYEGIAIAKRVGLSVPFSMLVQW